MNIAKEMSEMVDVINVRNHIYTLVNGPRTGLLNREEEKELQEFARDLDREVVDRSLALKRGVVGMASPPQQKVKPQSRPQPPHQEMVEEPEMDLPNEDDMMNQIMAANAALAEKRAQEEAEAKEESKTPDKPTKKKVVKKRQPKQVEAKTEPQQQVAQKPAKKSMIKRSTDT